MLEIKINVEVDLSERAATLLRLKQPEDIPAAECNCTAADKDLKTFIKETVYEFLRDLQEHAKKPVEEPKPETEQSPVREEKAAPAPTQAPAEPEPSDPELATEADSSNLSPLASQKGSLDLSQIEQLLAEHCVDTKLYLQHDLTLQQLAQTIGINRFYLSQYFSRQSITYNTYINNLRINYFISRYQEVVKTQRAFTVQQLASESGYRSYSTFSLAFKQRMGQTVSTWMHDN